MHHGFYLYHLTNRTFWYFSQLVTESGRDGYCSDDNDVQPKRTDSSWDCTSDDNVVTVPTAKGGMRRKHHRAWTLSEVIKLVDGVSRYGPGRWSEIKRLAFASYAYRTSVDLKVIFLGLFSCFGMAILTFSYLIALMFWILEIFILIPQHGYLAESSLSLFPFFLFISF